MFRARALKTGAALLVRLPNSPITRSAEREPLRNALPLATVSLVALSLSVGCGFANEGSHTSLFACHGREGSTKYQNPILFTERVIPNEAASEIVASIRVNGTTFVIEGNSHWVSGVYRACAKTEDSIWFSPSGGPQYCNKNDQFQDLGVFNKVTGDLRYHVGDYLAVMTCRMSHGVAP